MDFKNILKYKCNQTTHSLWTYFLSFDIDYFPHEYIKVFLFLMLAEFQCVICFISWWWTFRFIFSLLLNTHIEHTCIDILIWLINSSRSGIVWKEQIILLFDTDCQMSSRTLYQFAILSAMYGWRVANMEITDHYHFSQSNRWKCYAV